VSSKHLPKIGMLSLWRLGSSLQMSERQRDV